MSSAVSIRKQFPYPILSVLLALAWLALSHSLAVVHWLSAAFLAWIIPQFVAKFLFAPVKVRWWPAVELFALVLKDIVMSNITVARLVLGPMKVLQPAWLQVPLHTQHSMVNALYASIITTTPGTVSAVVDEEHACIWVHALHCPDPAAAIVDMTARYETRLMHIFGANETSPSR